MPDIRLDGLTRRFGAATAVDDVSMVFAEGTVTCLLGPSGCGKTTLMRMIAGLETPTAGRIRFGDRDVTRLSARQRGVAMVFQYPVMYRTLTVAENIELPLARDRSLSAAERRARVDEVLDVLDLSAQRGLRIGDLDMGARQKVAVGRAIARRCDVVLFDEPTTNVEVHAKLQLIHAFKEFRRRVRQTIVYVTHDQTEAMTLADQIALMQAGVLSQCAAPRVLYDQPDSEFGGWFLGSPGMNFLDPLGEDGGQVRFAGIAGAVAAPSGGTAGLRAGIRPEYVRVFAQAGAGRVAGRVTGDCITIGGQHLLTLSVDGAELKAKVPPDGGMAAGSAAYVECPAEHVMLFRDGRRNSGSSFDTSTS